ncbi:MAG: hypothetical protein V1809_00355 [Planctomycetota bacterium]
MFRRKDPMLFKRGTPAEFFEFFKKINPEDVKGVPPAGAVPVTPGAVRPAAPVNIPAPPPTSPASPKPAVVPVPPSAPVREPPKAAVPPTPVRPQAPGPGTFPSISEAPASGSVSLPWAGIATGVVAVLLLVGGVYLAGKLMGRTGRAGASGAGAGTGGDTEVSAVVTPPSSPKPYTIVAATYRTRADARKCEVHLRGLNLDAFVRPSGKLFMTCVGHFAGRYGSDIDKMLNDVQAIKVGRMYPFSSAHKLNIE